MKQLLQNINDGKAIVEEVPIPTARGGMALVKTGASLVSAGTERMVVEFAEKSPGRQSAFASRPGAPGARQGTPRRLAHHRQGRFQPPRPAHGAWLLIGRHYRCPGQGMQGFKVGQRVACAGGGYAVHAEYNVVPRNLLTPLPENVDFESAAFTTLGAIALHGFRLAEPQIGRNGGGHRDGVAGILDRSDRCCRRMPRAWH